MRRVETNLIVSSDPNNGATAIGSLGNRFSLTLDTPIQIPDNAQNITVSMEEASVWWTVPNIITDTNDKFKLIDTGASSTFAHTYDLVIAQGLYDDTSLAAAIYTKLIEEVGGAGEIDPPLIAITAISATQKMQFTFNYVGISIDFSIDGTFREILGYDSAIVGPSASAPLSYLGDDIASFNQVGSFLIHSDIVTQGVRLNNSYSQILDQVLITVLPGSQIIQSKLRPPRISEPELQGTTRKRIVFWLTDILGQDISTAGEYFTCRIAIKYQI